MLAVLLREQCSVPFLTTAQRPMLLQSLYIRRSKKLLRIVPSLAANQMSLVIKCLCFPFRLLRCDGQL
jgi:hypothetical protein